MECVTDTMTPVLAAVVINSTEWKRVGEIKKTSRPSGKMPTWEKCYELDQTNSLLVLPYEPFNQLVIKLPLTDPVQYVPKEPSIK